MTDSEMDPETSSEMTGEAFAEHDNGGGSNGNAEDYTPPNIPDKVFFRIGDVAELLSVKPYVLRYWETEFPVIAPNKSASGQRVYRRSDVETLLLIKHLLYHERYSIEGARKRIRELRRQGQLATYKKETVMQQKPGVLSKHALSQVKKIVTDIEKITRRPVREVFKY